MRSFSLFTASTLLLLGVTGCPVKETCADGFMASGDDCVPVVIADMGPRDAGDAGPRDAGDAAVMDEGIDEGVDEGTPDAGPCGVPCTGTTLVCDEARGMCAECTATDGTACMGATPVCDTTSGSATEGSCVACNANIDCTSLAAAQCDVATHACVPCTGNAACVGRTDATVCGAGTCVECTAADESACLLNVCDVSARSCTSVAAGSVGVCLPCTSDRACAAGTACVMQRFDAPPIGGPVVDVGYACLPVGPTCPLANAPFVSAASLSNQAGTAVAVCDLAVTTCPGYLDFRTNGGIVGGCASDADCGAPSLDDALCRMRPAIEMQCTTRCSGPEDCQSGFACSATAPRYCCFGATCP